MSTRTRKLAPELRLHGSRPTVAAVATLAAVAAVGVGALALPGVALGPLSDRFGSNELFGWSLLALVTGGFTFEGARRPPILAAGVVGSAALLGAGPPGCAAIGTAAAIGGLARQHGLPVVRIVSGALLAWAMPGVLALAAAAGGPSLGLDHPFPLSAVVALWAVMAIGVPVLESLAGAVVLPPEERAGPAHLLAERFESHTVLAALTLLGAMSYAAIGAAAGLVVLLPMAAARVGFSLHEEGRRAVTQTLAAMSKLPEWVGIVDVHHTERVRDVVQRVALDLDLESRLRRDIVRAAEVHELGHLDTGADRDDRGRVARSGAAVLEQAEIRGRVQQIVHATDPDRPVHARDGDVELGAAIVSTACELDRLERVTDVVEAAVRVVTAIGKAHRSAGAYL